MTAEVTSPAQERLPDLMVATSSSALFDMSDSDRVFREEGVAAYRRYQVAREDSPLPPGAAFSFVRKLLSINQMMPSRADGSDRIEVILLSRNTSDTGLRILNSTNHHNLPVTRAAFTGGRPPYRYMKAFHCQLLLSTRQEDVRSCLGQNLPAAQILSSGRSRDENPDLNIAFDGDSVLFSDEAERIYQSAGLDLFSRMEEANASRPLMGGPLKPFLSALQGIQSQFAESESPIRTALITARSAPAHERVVKTLRSWNIHLDESLFLGGRTKAEFLGAFEADVFFDDQLSHCEAARDVATTGHVAYGIVNDP